MIERDQATTTTGTAEGAGSQRLYSLYDPQGSTIAVTDTSGNVVERYIYDPLGQVQALDANGNALVVGSNVPNTNEGKLVNMYARPDEASGFVSTSGSVAGSQVGWQYYWHGMRMLDTADVYIGSNGQAYSPVFGRWEQPQPTSGNNGYTYTAGQLANGAGSYGGFFSDDVSDGWQQNYSDAFWDLGSFGSAGNVTTPSSIIWASRVSGLVAASAFTLATLGTGAPAAWATVAGTWGGAAIGTGIGGAISYSQGNGFESGAGIGFQIGSMVGGAIPGLFTSAAVPLTCRLSSIASASLVGAGVGGAMGAASGYLDTRTLDGALQGFASGAAWGAAGGALYGALNPFVCFIEGTEVLLPSRAGKHAQPEFSSAVAVAMLPELELQIERIEVLVKRGGGERGNGGGQFLMARDENDPDGPLVPCEIIETFERIAYRLQVIRFLDDHGIEQIHRVTEEHPYRGLEASWTPSKALKPHQTVHGRRGMLTVIENLVEEHPEGVKVFNLTVKGAHTYFVRGEGSNGDFVWVHNADYDTGEASRLLRIDMNDAGKPVLPDEEAAHVVPTNLPAENRPANVIAAVQDMQDMFDYMFGHDMRNREINGISAADGHYGSHTNSFFLDAANEMRGATNEMEMLDVMDVLKDMLRSGFYKKLRVISDD